MDVSSRPDTKPTTTRKTRRPFLGLALALTASSLPAIATVSNPAATPHSVEAAARRRRKPKRRQQRPKFKVVTRTFSNPEAVTIPKRGRSGPAARYPSTIVVNGLRSGQIEKVTVSIRLHYSKPEDLDILLVGPSNTGVVLMSDAGGTTSSSEDLIFDQDAPGVLSDVLVSGVYQPSNYPVALDAFPAPAQGAFLATR